MADKVVVSVGTKRGLFVFESNARRRAWKRRGPFLAGWSVYHAIVDARRTPKIHAAAVSDVFATTTFSGNLSDAKLAGAKRPPIPPKPSAGSEKIYKQYGISRAQRVWHLEPGHRSEQSVLYAGTAPAGLFRSEDEGKNWKPVEGMNNHPTRKKWMPGFGGNCLHSIQVDPADPRRMYAGISAAGAFRSDDGGKHWKPINKAVARYIGAPEGGETAT
ncbi:MAG: hypothetical protein FD180_3627 [Planctomycetota bacterium]|nr:MAG: hypothetical protein FD180_3627 [Planctomycetota bacterium]